MEMVKVENNSRRRRFGLELLEGISRKLSFEIPDTSLFKGTICRSNLEPVFESRSVLNNPEFRILVRIQFITLFCFLLRPIIKGLLSMREGPIVWCCCSGCGSLVVVGICISGRFPFETFVNTKEVPSLLPVAVGDPDSVRNRYICRVRNISPNLSCEPVGTLKWESYHSE